MPNAQQRKCAVYENDSVSHVRNIHLQGAIEKLLNSPDKNVRISTEIVVIPVVVHVIHNNVTNEIGGDKNGNISDEQIFSQIKVLNNDFRRRINTAGFNTNAVGADMELNFELARVSPEGLPTTGIVRVFNDKPAYDVFRDNELLSSLSYWDSERYLNIWVTTLRANFIGYAEFPTGDFNGLDFEETNPATDGIIIDHNVFGNQTGTAIGGQYTYGRTLTHELGHWFGLIHTWGDEFCGTDYCDDTPQVSGPNNTATCVVKPSMCDGMARIPMIENYMDYTPDSCMNIFTADQKLRVRAILEISQRRSRLVKSAKLNYERVDSPELTILNNPGSNSNVRLKVIMPNFQDFEISIFSQSGRQIFTQQYVDFPGLLTPFSEFTSQKGVFIVRLVARNSIISKKVLLL